MIPSTYTEDGVSIQEIQAQIHKEMMSHVEHFARSEQSIFTNLISNWEIGYEESELEASFATLAHDWYHGNIIHGIVLACFNEFVQYEDAGRFCLSEHQLDDALEVLDYIIRKYNINVFERDYYDETPKETVEFILQHAVSQMPDHMKEAAIKFIRYLESREDEMDLMTSDLASDQDYRVPVVSSHLIQIDVENIVSV